MITIADINKLIGDYIVPGLGLERSATFASINAAKSDTRLVYITADENNAGAKALYLFDGAANRGQILPQTASGGTTLNGTGYVKQSGTTSSYNATIPNADLTNSTISGIALGANLATLTLNSTNLTGTSYNGSGAVTLNTIQDITTTSNPQFTKLGLGTAPTSILHLSGNLSLASNFGVTGFGLRGDAATYTSTTSSGTIATAGANSLGIPTLAASSATTLTAAATLLINGAPVAGTNVGITTGYSIYAVAGMAGFAGGLSTGLGLSSNFSTAASTSSGVGSTSSASVLFGGAAIIYYRAAFNGATSSTLTLNTSYTNVIIGSTPITAASTGTHAVLANMVVNPLGTITNASSIAITETASLLVNGAGSGGTTNLAFHVTGSSAQSNIDGKLVMGGVLRLKNFTVAGLPTGTQGDTAYVTDAAASPTWGSTATGGGSVVVRVFYNGTNWIYS